MLGPTESPLLRFGELVLDIGKDDSWADLL